jgi:phosphatidylglycerophosphate synthase
VLLVIFGRELAVTAFRSYALKKGQVISAGRSGKNKALAQDLFIGGVLLWYPLLAFSLTRGWAGDAWRIWSAFHQAFIGITLAAALVLTVYSMVDYFWKYRGLLGGRP